MSSDYIQPIYGYRPPPREPSTVGAWLCLFLGAVIGVLGWNLPISMHSVHPAVITAAGELDVSAREYVREFEQDGRSGEMQLVREVIGMPETNPGEPAEWVGDFFLKSQGSDGVTTLSRSLGKEQRMYLSLALLSGSDVVTKGLMGLTSVREWKSFQPVGEPGGQVLEAMILMTAAFVEGGKVSTGVREDLLLALSSAQEGDLEFIEKFFTALIGLTKRLEPQSMAALLRSAPKAGDVIWLADRIRKQPDDFTVIYSASVMSGQADVVADYLAKFKKRAITALEAGVVAGPGGLDFLLRGMKRLESKTLFVAPAAVEWTLKMPFVILGLKWFSLLLGAAFVVWGYDGIGQRSREPDGIYPTLRPMHNMVATLLFSLILVVAAEPFLFEKPAEERKLAGPFKVMPVLSNTARLPAEATKEPTLENLELSTIVSVAVFGLLQLFVYLVCLQKINEIDRQQVSNLLKLKLMENEENLFDAGLYVGIGGTAFALVLQVLGFIDANLVAAYSSNLFGITCVAFVKIRHVRPYKRDCLLKLGHDELDAVSAPVK
ncbi:hypothetical protein N9059_00680 [bacterium]|nr:hypothetical protein [bacterium]